jgi:uncharacterized damage-inducible protein DinB
VSVPALAQSPAAGAADPISGAMKQLFDGVARNVVESATKVPEDLYAFEPTPEVRTFGQLIGHVADAMFSYCGRAGGKTPPMTDVEKTKTSKADLVAALEQARTFCEGIYGGTTDASAAELVQAGQNQVPRARLLVANISHVNEHYGNLVTYMRLKGLVPPSTERAQQNRR